MEEQHFLSGSDSTEAIKEIENRLGFLLKIKIDAIEKELEQRINQEKEAAQRKKEAVEQAFKAEKEALSEFRLMIKEVDEKRENFLNEFKISLEKVLNYQAQIGTLTRLAIEEIKKLSDIQENLEVLRDKTFARAAFLKEDLKERFGIVAEIAGKEEKPPQVDLDREIEKLRKIKELLSLEASTAETKEKEQVKIINPEANSPFDFFQDKAESLKIPEIKDLVLDNLAGQDKNGRTNETEKTEADITRKPGIKVAVSGRESDEVDNEPLDKSSRVEGIEVYRKADLSTKDIEIYYFHKDGASVLDMEKFFQTVDAIVLDVSLLMSRLDQVKLPDEKLFIQQKMTSIQDKLRHLLVRIVKMCQDGLWMLPRISSDILNLNCLKQFLELTNSGSWTEKEALSVFSRKYELIREAFYDRISPRVAYWQSLRKDIGLN